MISRRGRLWSMVVGRDYFGQHVLGGATKIVIRP
jgi:hypothetical protein